MALPADGVSIPGGWLHVVAVTINWSPFLPRLTAGLHQLLGRYCNEKQIPWFRLVPPSAAGRMVMWTQLRISSLRCYKIWLQDIWSATEPHPFAEHLPHTKKTKRWFWWMHAENSKYNLCFSFQTPWPCAHFHWQGGAWNPRLYKITFKPKLSFSLTFWLIRVGLEWKSNTLALHFKLGQGADRAKTHYPVYRENIYVFLQ